MNELEEGDQYIKKAFEINPDFIDGYIAIGNWHFLNCEYEKAMPYYKKVLEINPAHPLASTAVSRIEAMTPPAGKTIKDIADECLNIKELLETVHLAKEIKEISEIQKITKLTNAMQNIPRM